MTRAGYDIKIVVDFFQREDGGLRATSPDVPGLVLSAADPDAVLQDLAPAIEHIMKLNHGLDVEMRPLTPARQYLESKGVIKPTGQIEHMEFAGRLRAA
jgi:hypothetical protein